MLNELLILFIEYSYIICFLGAFIGGEETILALSIIAAQGYLQIWVVFIFCYLGIFASDTMWFFIGRIKSLSKFKKNKTINKSYKKAINLIEKTSKNQNFLLLLITKFIYGIRISTIMYVGRHRLSYKKFAFFNSIIIFIWMLIIVGAGWLAGKGFSVIIQTYKNLQLAIIILAIAIIVFYIIRILISKILKIEENII